MKDGYYITSGRCKFFCRKPRDLAQQEGVDKVKVVNMNKRTFKHKKRPNK